MFSGVQKFPKCKSSLAFQHFYLVAKFLCSLLKMFICLNFLRGCARIEIVIVFENCFNLLRYELILNFEGHKSML